MFGIFFPCYFISKRCPRFHGRAFVSAVPPSPFVLSNTPCGEQINGNLQKFADEKMLVLAETSPCHLSVHVPGRGGERSCSLLFTPSTCLLSLTSVLNGLGFFRDGVLAGLSTGENLPENRYKPAPSAINFCCSKTVFSYFKMPFLWSTLRLKSQSNGEARDFNFGTSEKNGLCFSY